MLRNSSRSIACLCTQSRPSRNRVSTISPPDDPLEKTLSVAILDVQYENVVANPENELRKILNFLDLPWEESCLRFYESTRITKTASRDQVRKPIYTSSKHRYKNFDKHIQTLIQALANQTYL